jgi:catalase
MKDQYRHCKPIFAIGAADQLLTAPEIDDGTAGLLKSLDAAADVASFIEAIAQHRYFERQTDPPII